MELIVGMAVMTIFMTIFTGAVLSMARTITKVEAVTTSSAQVNNAFITLDTVVRYASSISAIGGGTSAQPDWYVELGSVDAAGGEETCTQLRVDVTAETLQMRHWTAVSPSQYDARTLSPWRTLASDIRGKDAAGDAYEPFAVPATMSPASTTYQRLTIKLVAGSSRARSAATTTSSLTFTALNSSEADPTNDNTCRQVTRR